MTDKSDSGFLAWNSTVARRLIARVNWWRKWTGARAPFNETLYLVGIQFRVSILLLCVPVKVRYIRPFLLVCIASSVAAATGKQRPLFGPCKRIRIPQSETDVVRDNTRKAVSQRADWPKRMPLS